MLLAVDAGNTQMVFGLFEGDVLRADWRVATRRDATSDELGVRLRALFALAGYDVATVDGMIVSSVVPDLDGTLDTMARRYLDTVPTFVGPGMRTGMPILVENPHDVGADRIVNAVAAVARRGAPVLVLDFGTATTLDVVSPAGEYIGGVIAPGLNISAEALFSRAARLHRVEVRRPDHVIGRSTAESIQSGLFHGYASLVDGVVQRARAELGVDAPVIATGGIAAVFGEELATVDDVDPNLTLTGLRLLWERNRR